MAIYLKSEWRTELEGDGDGFIRITQWQDGCEQTIWLSLHQFQTILNHEKTLTREAVGGLE
jgi:hypothetical protein